MPGIEKKILLSALAVAIVTLSSVPSRADESATLYKSKCAMCHGADGKGETPAGKKMGVHDFASPEVQGMKDAEIASAIADGKNKMPAYKKTLSADQIKDLVTYVRSFGKK